MLTGGNLRPNLTTLCSEKLSNFRVVVSGLGHLYTHVADPRCADRSARLGIDDVYGEIYIVYLFQ